MPNASELACWQSVYNAGAFPQRLLWASTGTKDPSASDILYVKALAMHTEIGTIIPADGLIDQHSFEFVRNLTRSKATDVALLF